MAPDLLPDLSELETENRKVLSHHRNLQSRLRSITALASMVTDDWTKEQLLKEAEGIQNGVDRFDGYLRHILPPKYYNEQRAEDSIAAERVFNIPELLELILEETEHDDIMYMSMVSRNIKAIVEASSKLQTRLHLKLDRSVGLTRAPYTLFDDHVPGISVSLPSSGTVTMSIWVSHLRSDHGPQLPEIGDAWKRKFISQPPPKKMETVVRCVMGEDIYLYESEHWSVSSLEGLTLGDVYEVAEASLAEHTGEWRHMGSFGQDFGASGTDVKHMILQIFFRSVDNEEE